MPALTFTRFDVRVTVRATREGGATVELHSASGQYHGELSPAFIAQVEQETATGAATERRPLAEALGLTADLTVWNRWRLAPIPDDYYERVLKRLLLDVRDGALSALPWEALWQTEVLETLHLPGEFVGRASSVPARSLNVPLTVPLRFLHVDAAPGAPTLREMMEQIFGGHDPAEIDQAVLARTVTFNELEEWRREQGWPTCEVLHFDHLPTLEDEQHLLSGRADSAGTLAWLERVANAWQTRLVVVQAREGTLAVARRLGAALVGRGGPAVLVASSSAAPDFFIFYDALVHDNPLDIAYLYALRPPHALFVGSGRAEALRVSAVGEAILGWLEEMEVEMAMEGAPPLEVEEMLGRVERPHTADDLLLRLDELRSRWDSLTFHEHEGEGLLPMAGAVSAAREATGLEKAADWEAVHTAARTAKAAAEEPRERYVNSHLAEPGEDGKPAFLEQSTAALTVGEPYYLGIQIGPRDEAVRVVGQTALVEEVFKWQPEMEGVWLQVAVTALDFDVAAEPVQELWLPRNPETLSELIYFPVTPLRKGVSRLRFTVHFESDVIQSFRLAALTLPAAEAPLPAEGERRRMLAEALTLDARGSETVDEETVEVEGDLAAGVGESTSDLDYLLEDVVGDVGYLARLEYSVTTDLPSAESRDRRALSIVANDLNGESVLSIKGERFDVVTSGDLPRRIESVREVFHQIDTEKQHGVDMYTFDLDNSGTPQQLRDALKELAVVGYSLYTEVIGGDVALLKELAERLDTPDQVIHVAQILTEKVIPWGVVYDRPYDPFAQMHDDEADDVCLAALPETDGTLPVRACGTHPECLLHADRAAEREAEGKEPLVAESVVCPLHFWGYRHVVELPPQQTYAGTVKEEATCIPAEGKARLVVGYNAGFPKVEQHVEALQKIGETLDAVTVDWVGFQTNRNEILKSLEEEDLNMIYFYCHAYVHDRWYNACLDFTDEEGGAQNNLILAPNFAAHPEPWPRRPLVFLNGCRTASFSPQAPSPFLKQLIARGAAGMIGTDIDVWTPLATEVALQFLSRFLAGASAGEALLGMRRSLLAKHNPMGLVYTLYAAHNLHLDTEGDCS
ncbi:MAG: CHAT domain-containing protein [Candidatus Promineifilaceae bacterium]|nr:CHAT domain-containing protein [Candidatus Promineifilaceae bacterium]